MHHVSLLLYSCSKTASVLCTFFEWKPTAGWTLTPTSPLLFHFQKRLYKSYIKCNLCIAVVHFMFLLLLCRIYVGILEWIERSLFTLQCWMCNLLDMIDEYYFTPLQRVFGSVARFTFIASHYHDDHRHRALYGFFGHHSYFTNSRFFIAKLKAQNQILL